MTRTDDRALPTSLQHGELHRLVVEHSSDLIALSDADLRILYASPSWRAVLGYDPDALVGTSALDLVHPDDLPVVHRAATESVADGHAALAHFRLRHQDRHWLDFEAVGSLVNDGSARPLILVAARDISDRTRAHAEQTRLAAIVEASDDGIIGKSLDGIITSWNAGAERIYGFTAEEAVGRSITMLVPPDRLDEIADIMDCIRRGDRVDHYETTRLRKDRTEIMVSITVSPLRDASGKLVGATTIARDITGRKRSEAELMHLASHDGLTGLANRKTFEEQLELALVRARRLGSAVAVIYLDIDNFKLVNDALGHRAGDELLREIATRLSSAAREPDLVARHGGDEFLVLLPDLVTDLEADPGDPLSIALAAAERFHEALKRPFVLEDTDLYVSASMGVSVFPTTAADAGGLLSNADSAMFRSKDAGPGRTLIAPPRDGDPRQRLEMATLLRRAADTDEWLLRYQPIVDLSDGHLVGVEALVRWRRPDGEEVLPGEFLPIAQEIGLMERIGDWVVKEVCRQAREWRDLGLSILTSVNLSPVELRRRDVLRVVVEQVEAAGIDPSSLVIEVTESAAMLGGEAASDLLDAFHENGLRIAIDDFGTGYSSLSRLQHIRPHILKIDRSFLKRVPDDPDATSVATAIIELARTLGMAPLAEGIEIEDQWRFLASRGCTLGQGRLFGMPLEPEEVAILATGGRAPSPRPGGGPLRPVPPHGLGGHAEGGQAHPGRVPRPEPVG